MRLVTSGRFAGNNGLVFPGINPDADPDGYLFGRVVVFTGTLMSMTRQIAWGECARVGALAEKTPTKRTNVLVVGDLNPAVLRPGSNITGKARKAFELQDKGQDIEVMTEDDFVRCLDGGDLDKFGVPDPNGTSASVKNPQRSLPLDQRRQPKQLTSPKPLRRERASTDQACSVESCPNTAAFRTRSKPTYCDDHIAAILRVGGLEPMESFTHPDDYLLTRCLGCTNAAHYRFNYVLDKNAVNEATCRACYWREWAREVRQMQGPYARAEAVPFEKAQAIAEKHGFIYLGPLTDPSLPDDPHRTECRRCGKISAERLGDISFGCACNP